MDAFLELDAETGARRGELLGLGWSDLEANRLMIGRLLSQVGQPNPLSNASTLTASSSAIPTRAISSSAILTVRH